MTKQSEPITCEVPQPYLFLSYLDDFSEELQARLEDKTEEKSGEYLLRPRLGQTQRIFSRLFRYFWNWLLHRDPVNWLDVAGLAFIGWLRNTDPTLSDLWEAEDEWDDSIPVIIVPIESGKLYMVGGAKAPGDPTPQAHYDPPIAQIQRGDYHKIMDERRIKLEGASLKARGTVKDTD